MSRATLISRIVFALLVMATFTAFFVAQKLKRTDSLVYAVNIKKYVSPNYDGVRDRARLRFRTKKADVVTVEVIDRNGEVVRVLADEKHLAPGVHKFQWNGRYAAVGNRPGDPVPDGGYRVRIAMKRNGRTFVPDKFFVVDTVPPKLSADVVGAHSAVVFTGHRRKIRVAFGGVSDSRAAEFRVYRVIGQRTVPHPVAAFMAVRGKPYGEWNQTLGQFRLRKQACDKEIVVKGRLRPAPRGNYVIVASACDAAGNVGSSSQLPPSRGTTRGRSGVSLRGIEVAPASAPLVVGRIARVPVLPPPGGYAYRLRKVGGETVARGRARGSHLRFRVPRTPSGLYVMTVEALSGANDSAQAPVVITNRHRAPMLLVYPSISWQATNPVDVTGDGFGDPSPALSPGQQLRVRLDRKLATPALPPGFAAQEGALARFLTAEQSAPAEVTTDAAIAGNPDAVLAHRRAVLFAGDERWITPRLGSALRHFAEGGGHIGYFSLDAFRRTVSLAGGAMAGPSERRARDIFGESAAIVEEAPAPVVRFSDDLGLLQPATGLFTDFEQRRLGGKLTNQRTDGGRVADHPAFDAYDYDDAGGLIIRVGVRGWLAQAAGATADPNVKYSTRRILQILDTANPAK